MDAYSWLRRSVSKFRKTSSPSSSATTPDGASATSSHCNSKNGAPERGAEEEQHYGITEQLIEFIKSFSLERFRNFSLPDGGGNGDDGGISGNLRKDLSDWQEKHAMLVLSRVKELAQLRFKLCPRFLKERDFWRIYFALVKGYVSEYELRAIRLAKLKQMSTGNERVSNSSVCEVEMYEAKYQMPVESANFRDQNGTEL